MATLEIESRTFRYQRYVDDLVDPRGPGPQGPGPQGFAWAFSLTLSQLSYVTELPSASEEVGGGSRKPGRDPGRVRAKVLETHVGGRGAPCPRDFLSGGSRGLAVFLVKVKLLLRDGARAVYVLCENDRKICSWL